MSALPRGTPTSSKGVRYLGLLDQALCNGNWSEVPELARKVEKHAPERRGLTTAARAEVQIASASHRPGSAASSTATSLHALAGLLPKLKEVVSAEQTRHADDAFIVTTAIAKIYWLQEDPTEALALLGRQDPATLTNASREAGNTATTLGWLEVCTVQSTLIKAECLNATARSVEALQLYQSAAAQTPGYRTPELRKWTERLLARACMDTVKNVPTSLSPDLGEAYNVFKSWGLFWQRATSSHAVGASESSFLDVPRKSVWKAYYDILSTVLSENLVFNSTAKSPHDLLQPYSNNVPETQRVLSRRAQYAELRNVETIYENILLTETRFPRSDQHNSVIESWVDQVMANWAVLTSAAWSDADIGEGGRTTVSRCVLSILYRAATKTFHSTTILRHLFTVHASLEEFDLALHAFDSYAEIVDRGKAREEKTGQHEAGIDEDSVAVETAAHAIRVLCRYGDRQQIEKAAEIGKVIQKWLGHQDLETTREDLEVDHVQENPAQANSTILKAATLATAYRALAISQAESAHLTHEKRTRSELFKEANNNLRRAQTLDENDIRIAHALALVLAETRDVSGAIKVIKCAIARDQKFTTEDRDQTPGLAKRAPSLVPMWHLLALCLTSKDEHEAAMQVCETAFQQFGNLDSLIGHAASAGPEGHANHRLPGSLEALDGAEKETLIQIKLTQIALVELTEGPEEAVDQADELLSLYSRLFGYPRAAPRDSSQPPATAASTNTQRRGGALKSITGSIRPRSVKSANRTSDEKDALTQHSLLSSNTLGAVEENANGRSLGSPIEITVTNENGIPAKKQHEHHSHLPHMPKLPHLHLREPNSASDPQTAEGGDKASTGEKAASNSVPPETRGATQPEKDALHAPSERDTSLGLIGRASQLSNSQSVSSGSSESSMHARRHAVSLLVNIFTFIAGIFTRAHLFDDAQNAIDDAKRWTSTFEAEISKAAKPATARSFFFRGWGCGQSADELWADIWAAKAQLSVAQNLPFDAMANYEEALSYAPDHAVAVVGISNILMDIFEEKMPAEEPLHPLQPLPLAGGTTSLITEARPALTRPNSSANGAPSSRPISQINIPTVADELPQQRRLDPSPAELNRLAARDRAYMLLRTLSTTGHGWDDSEAWYALARAHELSREIAKAKAALWWVVELENLRPVRGWKVASPGGYAL